MGGSGQGEGPRQPQRKAAPAGVSGRGGVSSQVGVSSDAWAGKQSRPAKAGKQAMGPPLPAPAPSPPAPSSPAKGPSAVAKGEARRGAEGPPAATAPVVPATQHAGGAGVGLPATAPPCPAELIAQGGGTEHAGAVAANGHAAGAAGPGATASAPPPPPASAPVPAAGGEQQPHPAGLPRHHQAGPLEGHRQLGVRPPGPGVHSRGGGCQQCRGSPRAWAAGASCLPIGAGRGPVGGALPCLVCLPCVFARHHLEEGRGQGCDVMCLLNAIPRRRGGGKARCLGGP